MPNRKFVLIFSMVMVFLLSGCGNLSATNPAVPPAGQSSSVIIGDISSSSSIPGIISSSSVVVVESSSSSIPVRISSSSVVVVESSSSSIPVRISSSSVVVVVSSSSSIPVRISSSSSIAVSSSSVTTPPAIRVLLVGNNVNSNGPLETIVEENLSFSGGGHILVRPRNLTTEPNTRHPVVIWGPGGSTAPREYLMLLNRIASHGFVAVGIRVSSGGSELMSAAIDWLEQQNANSASPMFGKLILNRVGVFGHSMGGLSAQQAGLRDTRVGTVLLNNSGAFDHAQLVNMRVPTGSIYGENGMERPNAEGDYNNPRNRGPLWLGMMAGGGHGSGPWDGAGANIAWMRWHIGGESSRRNEFMGQGGVYNNTGIWTTRFKNWENWRNWNE